MRRSADLDSHKNLLFHTVHQLCESACNAYALKLLDRMLGLLCVKYVLAALRIHRTSHLAQLLRAARHNGSITIMSDEFFNPARLRR